MPLNFLSPRKPFLGLALAAVAGIFIADRWPLPVVPLLFVIGAFGLVLLRWQNAWLCGVFAGLAFSTLHTLQHHHGPGLAVAARLRDGPQPGDVKGIVWSEPASYTGFRGEKRASFTLKIESLRMQDAELRNCGMCLVRWSGAAPLYGDVVHVLGTFRPMEEAANPGEFDTANWLRRRGVNFEIASRNESDCEVTGHGKGSMVMNFAIEARAWVRAKLESGIEDAPELTTLIESMVLGLRGETPPEMKGLFQKTGTLHLFAVSGLNVAMLAWIAWYLLKPMRISRPASFFIILPLLIAYAVVTGLSASCVRATVMAAFVLAAPLFERPAVPVNSLAAAAVAILAWDTNQLFTPGFQLSFVLVLFIMGLTSPIARRMEPLANPDEFVPPELWSALQRLRVDVWKKLSQATGVTVSAWLGSFAFMAGYFHLISPVAIVANAVAVPIAFGVLALGLMSLLCGMLVTGLSTVVNSANLLLAKALLGSLAMFSKVPGGHLYVEVPALEAAPLCEVTSLGVGEGAAIHIRAGSRDWLLDCGGARDYDNTLLPYLRSRGVNRLDGLILTHGDSGHLGAASSVFDDFRPCWVADTVSQDRSPSRRGIHAVLAATGFGRRYLERGDTIALAPGVKLDVLYPPAAMERAVSDDKAIVCRVEAAGLRILCVSDSGFFTEQWLLENQTDLRADVLVKGWHNSDLSGTPDFLARVRPGAIVSSALPFGARAGRATETDAGAREGGPALFDQERCGAVRIELKRDGELLVRSFVGGQVFRSRAR